MPEIDSEAVQRYRAANDRYDAARDKVDQFLARIRTVASVMGEKPSLKAMEQRPVFPFSEKPTLKTIQQAWWPTDIELIAAYQELFAAMIELESAHEALPEGRRDEITLPDFS